jgi:hypothetical protein
VNYYRRIPENFNNTGRRPSLRRLAWFTSRHQQRPHAVDLSNILVFCASRRLGMFPPRRNLLVSSHSSGSCCHSEISYRNMELTPLLCVNSMVTTSFHYRKSTRSLLRKALPNVVSKYISYTGCPWILEPPGKCRLVTMAASSTCITSSSDAV